MLVFILALAIIIYTLPAGFSFEIRHADSNLVAIARRLRVPGWVARNYGLLPKAGSEMIQSVDSEITVGKPIATLLFLLVSCLLSRASYGQLGCSANPELALLDFWFGEWRVEDEDGELLGSNIIYRMLNGCIVQEQWQGSGGGVGISVFYVEPAGGKLKQLWITGQALMPGGTKEKELVAAEHGEFVQFLGSYPNGEETILDRTTLSRLPDGEVLQLIEISRDHGESWETGFRGIYKPINGGRR